MQDSGTASPRGARQTAEETLRHAILSGDLLPGQKLTERGLCALTGVCRTTVREAVRQLESEGLINSIPHRGPIVAMLSPAEARDLYELRAILEGQAGRLCAARATTAQITAMHDAIAAMDRAREGKSMLGSIEAGVDFYTAFHDGAANEALRQATLVLHNRLAFFRFASTRWPGRAERSIHELREIAGAISRRDAVAAEAACVRHIEASAELALLVLAEQARGAMLGRHNTRPILEKV